jgi:hypothetical protein
LLEVNNLWRLNDNGFTGSANFAPPNFAPLGGFLL